MSSSPRNSEAGRNLPEGGPDDHSVSHNVFYDRELSPFEPSPGLVAAEPQPALPSRPTWQPVDQEALIQRHPSLTGLVNPALLPGSVENHLARGDAVPSGGGRRETASPPPPQSGRADSPRSWSDATGDTSPTRRPPLGSLRKPPLPPSSPPSRAAESATRELSGSARGEDGGGDPEQNISTPLLGRTEGEHDMSRPQAWGGFGTIASRFAPESMNGNNTDAKQPAAARQRHLSLPNFVGNLFGIKQNDPTETHSTPDTTGVSHLRGGSFGLPNYGPGGVPPAALASRNAGRRWARSGSWAPGHVVLVQPRPLVDTNVKDPKAKTEPNHSPVSSTIFEDREEELGDDEPLCRICLDLLIMEGMEQMKMQCKCRGELALAHKECAVKWFTIRGSRICDVCGSEVENLPVIIYRRPPPRVLVPMRPMPTLEIEEDRQEAPATCLDYPVLVLASILLHFCFIQQLLVKDLGQTALLVAFPFGCLLGMIVAVTSRATVSRFFVWLFAAFEFFLIVIYTNVFYKMLRRYEPFTSENPLAAILGLLLGAFCGLGTSLGLHTIVTECGNCLHDRERPVPVLPSAWEHERALSDFWGTDWDDSMSVRSTGSRWSRGRVGGGLGAGGTSPPRAPRWIAPSIRNPRSTRTVTPFNTA